MSKDDFKSRAGLKDKIGKAGTASTGAVIQVRPASPGLSPPVPKPPFGMPVMPVAAKIKILPVLVEDKKQVSSFQRSQKEDE